MTKQIQQKWYCDPHRDSAPVAALTCKTYSKEDVRPAMERLVELLGGLDWVYEGINIAIKVNLVAAMNPDEAATTHPVLISELCRLLTQKGAHVIVGDSPGGLFNEAFVGRAYKKCGFDTADLYGAKLNHDYTTANAAFEKAAVLKSFTYTGWLDRADAIINFCKFKTHAMMAMSCGVKNLFGTIPGTTKPEYHMRFPESASFANLMVDLNEYFKPVWNIVDAVDGMEGNGPTAGTPRHVGMLLGSLNPYSLDMVCAYMMGLTREDVPTLQEAYLRRLGPDRAQDVMLIGDGGKVRKLDFKLVTRHMSTTFAGAGPWGALVSGVGRWALRTRPQVKKNACIGCRKCEQVCPAGAISMKEKRPQIDRRMCIRCFCCQEFCPKGAMRVQHTWIGKLISRIDRGKQKQKV